MLNQCAGPVWPAFFSPVFTESWLAACAGGGILAL
ncbi:hypothetical protein RTM1035_12303 [Roseovarius sp. TM1035]|nr:hypothetical protein RTM1035_12303 [Roseovarius sp. TM1035]